MEITLNNFNNVNTIKRIKTPVVRVEWNNILIEKREPRQIIIKHILDLTDELTVISANILSSFFHIESRLSSEIITYMVEQNFLETKRGIVDYEEIKRKLKSTNEISLDEIILDLIDEQNEFFKISDNGYMMKDREEFIKLEKGKSILLFPEIFRYKIDFNDVLNDEEDGNIENINDGIIRKLSFENLLKDKKMFNIPKNISKLTDEDFNEHFSYKGYFDIYEINKKLYYLRKGGFVKLNENHSDYKNVVTSMVHNQGELKNKLIEFFTDNSFDMNKLEITEQNAQWVLDMVSPDQNEIINFLRNMHKIDTNFLKGDHSGIIRVEEKQNNISYFFKVKIDIENELVRNSIHYWDLMEELDKTNQTFTPDAMINQFNKDFGTTITIDEMNEFLFENEYWNTLNIIQAWEDLKYE